MREIVGLAGRLESGKSFLAKEFENKGFKKLYFALPLKNLVCDLLGFSSIDELNQNKYTVNAKYKATLISKSSYIAKITQIPEEKVQSTIEKCDLQTVRDVLQVVGTNVIRCHNTDWHVNELKKIITSKEYRHSKIIIDDVRFLNERDLIRKLGGNVIYVIRNKFNNISHHTSEESIEWNQCDGIFLNTSTEERAKEKINWLIDNIEKVVSYKDGALSQTIMDEEWCAFDDYLSNNCSNVVKMIRMIPYTISTKYGKRIELSPENHILLYQGKETYTRITNPLCIEECKMFLGIEDYTLHYRTQLINDIPDIQSTTKKTDGLSSYLINVCRLYLEDYVDKHNQTVYLNNCVCKDHTGYPDGSDGDILWYTHIIRIDKEGCECIATYYELDEGEKYEEGKTKLHKWNIWDASPQFILTIINSLKEEIDELA